MAPGKAKKVPKAKGKGVGIDFKKVKHKVGRKLPPPKNETRLDFTTKSIVLAEQSVAQNKEGVAVNHRRQSLKELLTQTTHYSERVRKESITGIKDLISRHPAELTLHAATILEKLSPRISDGDKSVRQAFLLLLRSAVFPGLQQTKMGPVVAVMMAHVCSAMTHMTMDIRLTAFGVLDLLLLHYPTLVVPMYSGEIMQYYVDILGKGGVNKQASERVLKIMNSLEQFLSVLQISVVRRASRGQSLSSGMHSWGAKYDLNKQDDISHLSALHCYRSVVQAVENLSDVLPFTELKANDGSIARGEKSKQARVPNNKETKGNASQRSNLALCIIPVLLGCWAEFGPSVCGGPTPDSTNLSCMVCITRCLKLLLELLLVNAPSLPQSTARNGTLGQMAGSFEEEQGVSFWMRHQVLPSFLHHLLPSFPIASSSLQLMRKVEEDLVALNVGICEVMLQFIIRSYAQSEKEQTAFDTVLEYFHCALFGMMLPSSGLSSAVVDSKRAEPHIKSLVEYLPKLVLCLPEEQVSELLQAFTQSFEKSRAQSSLKLACLPVMVKMLLGKDRGVGTENKQSRNIPFEIQRQWLQSLPKLLWELKHAHPSVSQAVLQMLLHIGQTAPEGSLLLEEYTALQPAMVPFFCTSFASKNNRCVFGPFTKLPESCQQLAVDSLYYHKSISRSLLKAVAQCCLNPDVHVKTVMRAVEVLQRAFCRGAIGLTDHLSLLFTLVVGHTSTPDLVVAKNGPPKSAQDGTAATSYMQRKHCVIAGVVCACLTQIGDEALILQLLGASLEHELQSSPPPLDVLHNLLRVIAALSQGKRLPSALASILPKFVARFTKMAGSERDYEDGDSTVDFLFRPCMVLLAENASITHGVLEDYLVSLKEAMGSGKFISLSKSLLGALLRFFKDGRLDRSLSSSETTVQSILQTMRVNVNSATAVTMDGREVMKRSLQLEEAAGSVYGWMLGGHKRVARGMRCLGEGND